MATSASEKAAPAFSQGDADCQHHWVIESPRGPVSRGVCKQCGAVKEFQNYAEGAGWSSDVSLEQLAGGQSIPAGGVSLGTSRPWLEEE